jgi:hypothetical protein
MQICCETLAIILGFVWKNGFGANGGTFEQECQKFHNDAYLFHEYAHFNTFLLLFYSLV